MSDLLLHMCSCTSALLSQEVTWARYHPSAVTGALGNKFSDREKVDYINVRWGDCHGCKALARRHVAVVAILLAKLSVNRWMNDVRGQ